jgi:hypothetical protein
LERRLARDRPGWKHPGREAPAQHSEPRLLRLLAAGTDAPVAALAGRLWLRVSAAACNAAEDHAALAAVVERVLAAA